MSGGGGLLSYQIWEGILSGGALSGGIMSGGDYVRGDNVLDSSHVHSVCRISTKFCQITHYGRGIIFGIDCPQTLDSSQRNAGSSLAYDNYVYSKGSFVRAVLVSVTPDTIAIR